MQRDKEPQADCRNCQSIAAKEEEQTRFDHEMPKSELKSESDEEYEQ